MLKPNIYIVMGLVAVLAIMFVACTSEAPGPTSATTPTPTPASASAPESEPEKKRLLEIEQVSCGMSHMPGMFII